MTKRETFSEEFKRRTRKAEVAQARVLQKRNKRDAFVHAGLMLLMLVPPIIDPTWERLAHAVVYIFWIGLVWLLHKLINEQDCTIMLMSEASSIAADISVREEEKYASTNAKRNRKK